MQWIKSDVPSEKWNLLILDCHQDGSSSDMGEDKSSSLFFQGSIADAIVGAKTGQKILVVFVAGVTLHHIHFSVSYVKIVFGKGFLLWIALQTSQVRERLKRVHSLTPQRFLSTVQARFKHVSIVITIRN